MAEYIERSEALIAINEFYHDPKVDIAIRSIPSADVVEVVRCSECQHRHNPMRCALWYGTLDDNEYFLEHGNDFYCSFGERRSE